MTFVSFYFGKGGPQVKRPMKRNEVVRNENTDPLCPSVFQAVGRLSGKSSKRYLSYKEYNVVSTYVLLNTPEVQPFIQ